MVPRRLRLPRLGHRVGGTDTCGPAHVQSKVVHEVNKPRRDEPAACTVANISLTTGGLNHARLTGRGRVCGTEVVRMRVTCRAMIASI
eukprot:scaffold17541_cov118-Isochrysis_galbana.AAC.1